VGTVNVYGFLPQWGKDDVYMVDPSVSQGSTVQIDNFLLRQDGVYLTDFNKDAKIQMIASGRIGDFGFEPFMNSSVKGVNGLERAVAKPLLIDKEKNILVMNEGKVVMQGWIQGTGGFNDGGSFIPGEGFSIDKDKSYIAARVFSMQGDKPGNQIAEYKLNVADFATRNLGKEKDGPLSTVLQLAPGALLWSNDVSKGSVGKGTTPINTQGLTHDSNSPFSAQLNIYRSDVPGGLIEVDARSLQPMLFNEGAKHLAPTATNREGAVSLAQREFWSSDGSGGIVIGSFKPLTEDTYMAVSRAETLQQFGNNEFLHRVGVLNKEIIFKGKASEDGALAWEAKDNEIRRLAITANANGKSHAYTDSFNPETLELTGKETIFASKILPAELQLINKSDLSSDEINVLRNFARNNGMADADNAPVSQLRNYANARVNENMSGENYPLRFFATEALSRHIYRSTSSAEQIVGKWDVTQGVGVIWSDAPMFANVKHTISGGASEFVSGVQIDASGQVKGEIIAAALIDGASFNNNTFTLNKSGYAVEDGFKSGWRNINTFADYFVFKNEPNELLARNAYLEGVNFWVEKGGTHWLNFGLAGITLEGGKALEGFTAGLDISGKPSIEFGGTNTLVLSQALQHDKININQKTPANENQLKFASRYLTLTAGQDGIVNATGTQKLDFNVTNLNSPQATLSGDLRNVQGISSGLSGDVGLAALIKSGRGAVAVGGITLTDGEEFAFKNTGALETKHAGFWQGINNQYYNVMLQNHLGKEALIAMQGGIRWDVEGRLTEGENSFKSIMTAANNGHWYDINPAYTELQNGRLSVTTEDGVYTYFASAGGKGDKSEKSPATSRERLSGILVDKEGDWHGQASFFLSNFSYNFSGSISQDLRNYTGTSSYALELGNRKLVSDTFSFDSTGNIENGKVQTENGKIITFIDGKAIVPKPPQQPKLPIKNLDYKGRPIGRSNDETILTEAEKQSEGLQKVATGMKDVERAAMVQEAIRRTEEALGPISDTGGTELQQRAMKHLAQAKILSDQGDHWSAIKHAAAAKMTLDPGSINGPTGADDVSGSPKVYREGEGSITDSMRKAAEAQLGNNAKNGGVNRETGIAQEMQMALAGQLTGIDPRPSPSTDSRGNRTNYFVPTYNDSGSFSGMELQGYEMRNPATNETYLVNTYSPNVVISRGETRKDLALSDDAYNSLNNNLGAVITNITPEQRFEQPVAGMNSIAGMLIITAGKISDTYTIENGTVAVEPSARDYSSGLLTVRHLLGNNVYMVLNRDSNQLANVYDKVGDNPAEVARTILNEVGKFDFSKHPVLNANYIRDVNNGNESTLKYTAFNGYQAKEIDSMLPAQSLSSGATIPVEHPEYQYFVPAMGEFTNASNGVLKGEYGAVGIYGLKEHKENTIISLYSNGKYALSDIGNEYGVVYNAGEVGIHKIGDYSETINTKTIKTNDQEFLSGELYVIGDSRGSKSPLEAVYLDFLAKGSMQYVGGIGKASGSDDVSPTLTMERFMTRADSEQQRFGSWNVSATEDGQQISLFRKLGMNDDKLNTEWKLNTENADFYNIGRNNESTPNAPLVGVPEGHGIASRMSGLNGLPSLFYLCNPNEIPAAQNLATGEKYFWSQTPQTLVDKENQKYENYGIGYRAEAGNLHSILEPRFIPSVNEYSFQSPAGTMANSISSDKITGVDFLSFYHAERVPNTVSLVNLSADLPNGEKGGIWRITTLGKDNISEVSQVVTNGFVWTNKLENGFGVDLSQSGAIINDRNFDLYKDRYNNDVVPFANGLGVNLSGARIQNGEIVGPGVGENYITENGDVLSQRLFNGFQDLWAQNIFKDDTNNITLITQANGATLLHEVGFIGNKTYEDFASRGFITQELKGRSRVEIIEYANKRLGLDTTNEIIGKIIENKDGLKITLNLGECGLSLTPSGALKLLTPSDTLMFSYSHLLEAVGHGSEIPGLGKGVNLSWISPVAYGSDINIHSGTAGILFSPERNGQTGVTEGYALGFAPIYSAGAVWRHTPEFGIEVSVVGQSPKGQLVKYADRETGIHYSPDTWVGHLSNQSGLIVIGEGSNFYGDGAFIKSYASEIKPIEYSQWDRGVFNELTLTRLDLVNKFTTKGLTADAGGLEYFGKGVSIDNFMLMAAIASKSGNKEFNVSKQDFDLSYAQGKYKQTADLIIGGDLYSDQTTEGKIIDLGAATLPGKDGPVEAPTLIAQGKFFVPEIIRDGSGNQAQNNSSDKDAREKFIDSSVRPFLNYERTDKSNWGYSLENGNFYNIRINEGFGITGFTFTPYFNEKGGLDIKDLNISSLALSNLATWSGIDEAKEAAYKRGENSFLIERGGNYSLAIATSIGKEYDAAGKVTRVNVTNVSQLDDKGTQKISEAQGSGKTSYYKESWGEWALNGLSGALNSRTYKQNIEPALLFLGAGRLMGYGVNYISSTFTYLNSFNVSSSSAASAVAAGTAGSGLSYATKVYLGAAAATGTLGTVNYLSSSSDPTVLGSMKAFLTSAPIGPLLISSIWGNSANAQFARQYLAFSTFYAGLDMYRGADRERNALEAGVNGLLAAPGRGLIWAVGAAGNNLGIRNMLDSTITGINNREMNAVINWAKTNKDSYGEYWGPVLALGLAGVKSWSQAYTGSYLFQFAASPMDTVSGIAQMGSQIGQLFGLSRSGSDGKKYSGDPWFDAAILAGSLAGGWIGFRGLRSGSNTANGTPIYRINGLAQNLESNLTNLSLDLKGTAQYAISVAKGAPVAYVANLGLLGLTQNWSGLQDMAQNTDNAWRSAVGLSALGVGAAALSKPLFGYMEGGAWGRSVTATGAGLLTVGVDRVLSYIRG
ncbi:MAG: hypothetical protein ACYDFR_05600, partial [Candidatus Omnitrophota bacterium]